MRNAGFISSSSYVRVQEKRLLTADALARAADSADLAAALRILAHNSDYHFDALAKARDCENALKAELKRVYKIAYDTGHLQIAQLWGCKYDFHNCKAALKDFYHKSRTQPPFFAITNIDAAEIAANCADSAQITGLPTHLTTAIDEAKRAFEKTGNPQDIDIVLEKAMFAYMLALCGEIGSEMITAHVRAMIDFYNIKTFLRIQSMQKPAAFYAACTVPGGLLDLAGLTANYNKEPSALAAALAYKYLGGAVRKGVEAFEKDGNFSGLERFFDNWLIAHVRQAKYITYGPEILYAYLFSKENEIRQVRILVAGKANSLRADLLKERLRESYA